jgi:hypothetical protein
MSTQRLSCGRQSFSFLTDFNKNVTSLFNYCIHLGILVQRSIQKLYSLCRLNRSLPNLLAARSKAQVYGCSLAGIVGYNAPGGHGCLSVVTVVCCQVQVYVTGWSLVHRSRTECSVSQCDREALIMVYCGIWYMIRYIIRYDTIRYDIWCDIYDMIYLTAIGLSPGGSTHLHTNNT